jgi:hypothetical protein
MNLPFFDPDEFERRRARTFLWCGVVIGGLLGLLFGLYWFQSLPWACTAGVGAAAFFGWASFRWGDPAWEWVGRNLWWFS